MERREKGNGVGMERGKRKERYRGGKERGKHVWYERGGGKNRDRGVGGISVDEEWGQRVYVCVV